MGKHTPPPPANAGVLDPKKLKTNNIADILKQHRENPQCAGCHKLIDPLGLALENFDHMGRFRSTDASKINIGEKEIDGIIGLKKYLLENKYDFIAAISEETVSFIFDRSLNYNDQKLVTECIQNLYSNKFKYSTLITTILTSQIYQEN